MSLLSLLPTSERAPRIIVAENDLARRDLVASLMIKDGYEVRELTDAAEFFRTVDTFEPDLIVLADGIGSTSGAELCGELRAREAGRHTPIVLLGAEGASEEAVVRALLAGADDFITTLRRMNELSARVRVQLRNRRAFEAIRRLRAERDTFRLESTLDPLTGVLNRRSLEHELKERFACGLVFAVLFLDVDSFKRVNDEFGHDIGDEVLRTTARHIKRQMRANDVCGRYGGEEFIIVLCDIELEMAGPVAERHRAAIESIAFSRKGFPNRVTASLGVAEFDPASPDPSLELLLQRADRALYDAKNQGRNRVVVAPRHDPKKPVAPRGSESTKISVEPPPPSGRTVPSPRSDLEAYLLAKLSGRVAVPVLPDVAAEALRLANNPSSDAKQLARLVDKSPPIAARFLAIANSALYARGIRIVATDVAVMRLGLSGARDLLFQVVYEANVSGLPRYKSEVARSFKRSVLAGIAARAVATATGERHDYAYLFGLLHDIGEAHIYRILASSREVGRHDVVEDLVKRYHTRAGSEIATAWRLPAEIVEVCGGHHDDERAAVGPVRLVMLADALLDGDLERLAKLGMVGEPVQRVLRELREAAKQL